MSQLFETFIYALLAAVALTPAARLAALKAGLVDRPGVRRMHAVPMPKGGGVAIYAAFWFALVLSTGFTSQWWGLWAASTLMLLVGLADDRWELVWHQKIAGQTAAAILFVVLGGQIEFVTHPLTGQTLYVGAWGVPLTVAWLVALANMINLIDGLDGLAAGVSAIACVPLLIVAIMLGRTEAALLTAALGAATLGFLPYNFNPARIIMGDTGAMFLGFVLGAISVEGALKGPAALAFVVPILAFGLPIFDTFFAVVRRLAARRPFYKADTDHLHHRLLALGLSHRRAVLTLYGVSAVMAAAALLAIAAGTLWNLGLFVVIAAGSVLFALRLGGVSRERNVSR